MADAPVPMTPAQVQAAQAARHAPPAAPANATPPANPPTQVTPPQAAAAPSPVAYAPDTAMVRLVVDGKPQDVPVSQLRATAQLQSAAEKRLHENNRLLSENRQVLDTMARLRNLARDNPQAAQEEIHKVFGLRTQQAADNQGTTPDGEQTPENRAMLSELSKIRERLHGIEQVYEQVVTKDVEQQVYAAVRSFPLYQGDEQQAQRAAGYAAYYMQKFPGSSLVDVVGALHAQDAEFITRQVQAVRDQRAGNAQQLANVPPTAGTPAMSQVEITKITPEEMRKGGSFKGAMDFAKRLKDMAG